MKIKKIVWSLFWVIAAGIGAYALWKVFQFPSEARNAFWMGMSKQKLIMCGAMALMILFCLTAAIIAMVKKDLNIFSSGLAAGTISYFIIFLLIIGKIFLTPPIGKTALERSLLERLLPLSYWGFAFSVLSVIILIIQKAAMLWHHQTSSVPAIIWGLTAFLLMAGSIYYALRTGTGIDPISGTFYRQGVSLLEGHLILPMLFLYPLMPLFVLAENGDRSHKTSGKILCILACAGLWAAAVYFWQTAPFEGRSYFVPALRLPNNNFYPSSDAEHYDLLAQSILLGNGFRNGLTVVRPLYAAFLALLHWIFGNDYMQLTNGQILVLALIPVIIFMIGKYLRHTSSGLLAAVWIIWREIYSIRITHLVQVSNSRLLMSDLPTMLLVLAAVLAAVVWYRSDKKAVNALLCGGIIGASMLLRTQCFVIIPAVWLLFFCSGKKASVIWRSFILSMIGIILVFAPWTVWMRIHPNTTAYNAVSEDQYLVSLYRKAVGENDSSSGLKDILRSHPKELIQSVSAHFLNNELSSVLILPVRIDPPEEAGQLLYEDDLFWYRENARETIEKNKGLILLYLLLISFGIISVYRKAGFAGLAPLIIHLAYNLGNAFAMTSGFRFILPSDWTILIYFAFGCSALFRFLCNLLIFTPSVQVISENEPDEEALYGKGLTFVFSCILLILIGAILPFCDSMIPRRFEEKNMSQIAEEWKLSSENASLILADTDIQDMVFLEGRAFYPRFYKAGEGDSGGSASVKRGGESDRLVWMFHDSYPHVLNCDLTPEQVENLAMHPLTDPMDVIVAGIQKDDYIDVLEMRLAAPMEK